MHTLFAIALFILCFLTGSLCDAKESNDASKRDGSSEARAILVPVSDAKSHEWQIAYLKKHFPEHYSFNGPLSNLNQEHAFIAHEKQGKAFDYYSFTLRGRKIEVYFDVSKQFQEFTRAHAKPK